MHGNPETATLNIVSGDESVLIITPNSLNGEHVENWQVLAGEGYSVYGAEEQGPFFILDEVRQSLCVDCSIFQFHDSKWFSTFVQLMDMIIEYRFCNAEYYTDRPTELARLMAEINSLFDRLLK